MGICERGCTIKDQHLETCQDTCWGCLPVHTEGVVCEKCEVRFGRALVSMLEAWSDLYSQMANSKDYSLGERVSGTAAIGLVLNESVMALMGEVRDWAVFVTRIVATEDSGQPDDMTTVNALRFIKRHERFLVAHELAGEFVEDSMRLSRKVFNTAYPDGSKYLNITSAVCEVEGESGICGGALFAKIQPMPNGSRPDVRCKKSPKHEVSSQLWNEWSVRLNGLA